MHLRDIVGGAGRCPERLAYHRETGLHQEHEVGADKQEVSVGCLSELVCTAGTGGDSVGGGGEHALALQCQRDDRDVARAGKAIAHVVRRGGAVQRLPQGDAWLCGVVSHGESRLVRRRMPEASADMRSAERGPTTSTSMLACNLHDQPRPNDGIYILEIVVAIGVTVHARARLRPGLLTIQERRRQPACSTIRQYCGQTNLRITVAKCQHTLVHLSTVGTLRRLSLSRERDYYLLASRVSYRYHNYHEY